MQKLRELNPSSQNPPSACRYRRRFRSGFKDDFAFKVWVGRNVKDHQQSGYAIVNLAVKETAVAPGDVTDEQLEIMADLADEFSFGEIRVTTSRTQRSLTCVKLISTLFEKLCGR